VPGRMSTNQLYDEPISTRVTLSAAFA